MVGIKGRQIEEYYAFLASPGDVEDERQAVRQFFDNYNRTTGRPAGMQFTVLDWENYATAAVGRPQACITEQILEKYGESLALVIGLMAQRFGSKTGKNKSGTEEEFEWALRHRQARDWPEIKWFFKDIDRLDFPSDVKEAAEALEQWKNVQAFRKKVEQEGESQLLYNTYVDPDDFGEVLKNDLDLWLNDSERPWSSQRRGKKTPARKKRAKKRGKAPPPDPRKYLDGLYRETKDIDIRGLLVGSERAHTFSIDDLYIPLTTSARAEPSRGTSKSELREPGEPRDQTVELQKMLEHRCVVITGDPGAGKTTFLNRIANILSKAGLENDATRVRNELGLGGRPFPILIRIAELAKHITTSRSKNEGPANANFPTWLTHFLAASSHAFSWGLNERFFRDRLEGGDALVMLDGLDEVPTEKQRKSLVDLVGSASQSAYDGCRFVVTSRPAAYHGRSILPDFEHARIDDLDDDAIESFLGHWCQALFPDRPAKRKQHLDELLAAFRVQSDIRSMAHNPVMLTALAVVHWNQKRLPEQRAYLYESVLGWLAKARESREGRPTPERCITLLQNLALEMQTHKKGRQVQVSRQWAARAIAPLLRATAEDERVAAAEGILRDEELDSGIIVARGERDVRFWHLIFQEYLAGRALAGKSEIAQGEKLLATENLHKPEWREVVLLLAGVLHQQDIDRVDTMFKTILDQVDNESSLSDKALYVGLLGAILRDLSPVGYEPADVRYPEMADEVMGIFDPKKSRGIAIEVAIEAAEAIGRAGDSRFDEATADDNWVTIPAGEFWMGSQKTAKSKPHYDPDAYDDEFPPHEVQLAPYRIGRYPVTVLEYGRFVDSGEYGNKSYWEAGGFEQWQEPEDWNEQKAHPNRPVVGVSWYEATAYATWKGVRLPSEAEWERAARGAEGRRYPWGGEDATSLLANCEDNVGRPTPVGVYPRGASQEGVLDLAGNVWEWCADDWHGNYEGAPRDGSAWTGAGESGARVVRGGAWLYIAINLRSAYRNSGVPDNRLDSVGFRVAAGT